MLRQGEIEDRLRQLKRVAGPDLHDLEIAEDDAVEVRQLKTDLMERIAAYEEGWQEVASLGAVVKDTRTGLVDFRGPSPVTVTVAGVVTAIRNNGVGVAGTVENARIVPVRVLDSDNAGTNESLVEGLTWLLDNNLGDIINTSLIDQAAPDPNVAEMVRRVVNQGRLFFAGTGNSAQSVIPPPAGLPDVVSVASSENNDAPAGYSGYGINLDIMAPGGNHGQELTVLWKSGYCDEPVWNNAPAYCMKYGTSFASPYAAAVGAVVLRPPPAVAVGTAAVRFVHPASPVPVAVTTAGKTVVSVPGTPSQKCKASSCSILSCEYSAVRAARCPCVSVVETATAARPITPPATISNIARAIIVSITVSPAWDFRLRDKYLLCLHFICCPLIDRASLLKTLGWSRPEWSPWRKP